MLLPRVMIRVSDTSKQARRSFAAAISAALYRSAIPVRRPHEYLAREKRPAFAAGLSTKRSRSDQPAAINSSLDVFERLPVFCCTDDAT